VLLLPGDRFDCANLRHEFWRILGGGSDERVVRLLQSDALGCRLLPLFQWWWVGLLLRLGSGALVRVRGKRIDSDALMDLPFALPTASQQGNYPWQLVLRGAVWYGSTWQRWVFQRLLLTPWVLFVAMSFTSLPFVVRTVSAGTEDLAPERRRAQ